MRKIFEKIDLKAFMKVNVFLTGVFCVMLAGMIYMKSVNATESLRCPPGPGPECPPTGIHFIGHPTDPHWFYHCIEGVGYCKICPTGLVWVQEFESCSFPPTPNWTCHTLTTPSLGRNTFFCATCDWVPNTMPASNATLTICW